MIFVLEAVLMTGLPRAWTRADLMVAVCVEIARRFPFWGAIVWSFFWGYVSDVFQGRLWGAHGASYLLVLFLHRVWSRQMDTESMVYRMLLVGVGVLVQSLVSVLIVGGLSKAASGFPAAASQTVFSMVAAPFIMLPVQWILTKRVR
ncbi:rod shape-determining protein MreD [Desulfosoma caldarium]|uniref:Rod shape-determining protein MreD n=2 Tax=Desulfosoma caldarium TaxID=610254 RepID=A0A3N1VTK5_9BACT|nr:rod shape-determining protein MreD [Desulfosoma caldarium]